MDIWGSPINYESRLPQRLFMGDGPYINIGVERSESRPWVNPWIELRCGLKNVGATLIAAQIAERLIPEESEQQEMVFDPDAVKAYRAYLQTPIDLGNPDRSHTKLFVSLGRTMCVKPFVTTLEQDLAAFKEEDKVEEEEDPRFKALRPLIVRIVHRRVASARAKAVAENDFEAAHTVDKAW